MMITTDKSTSFLWINALSDAFIKASVAAISSVAFALFHSPFSVPAIYLTGSLFLTRLVVKIAEDYDIEIFKKIKRILFHFIKEYKFIQSFMCLTVLITARKYLILSNLTASSMGIIGGFTGEVYQYQKQQNIERAQINKS